MAGLTHEELRQRIDAIENAYEFMLAYAAQGLSTHQASKAGAELRSFLGAAEEAIDRLADLFAEVVKDRSSVDSEAYSEFVAVLREDSRRAGAAVRLVLAQPAISSQLIDNLNASIHLRTLLTDVFLLDEVLEPRSAPTAV